MLLIRAMLMNNGHYARLQAHYCAIYIGTNRLRLAYEKHNVGYAQRAPLPRCYERARMLTYDADAITVALVTRRHAISCSPVVTLRAVLPVYNRMPYYCQATHWPLEYWLSHYQHDIRRHIEWFTDVGVGYHVTRMHYADGQEYRCRDTFIIATAGCRWRGLPLQATRRSYHAHATAYAMILLGLRR